MIDNTTRRKRSVRETILDVLGLTFEANPDQRLRLRDIKEGFATGAVPPSPEDVNEAVADLHQRGMIGVDTPAHASNALDREYYITPKGRDFRAHGYPWDLVDSFSNG